MIHAVNGIQSGFLKGSKKKHSKTHCFTVTYIYFLITYLYDTNYKNKSIVVNLIKFFYGFKLITIFYSS